VTLKPNAPLRIADVRESIEKLYATGRYGDIQVDAEPRGDGVVVRFITRNSWFVGRVSADGAWPISESRANGQCHAAAARPAVSRRGHDASEIGLRSFWWTTATTDPIATAHRVRRPDPAGAHSFIVESGPRAKYAHPSSRAISKWLWTKSSPPPGGGGALCGWRPVTQSRTRQGVDNIRRNMRTPTG